MAESVSTSGLLLDQCLYSYSCLTMRDKGRWRAELWETRDRKIGCMVVGQNSK